MKGIDGEQEAMKRPPGLVERVERLERQVTEHAGAQEETESIIHRDLRYLAEVLGVRLPSDEPRNAIEPSQDAEDRRGRGGWRS